MKRVTMSHLLVPLFERSEVVNNLELGGGEHFNSGNGSHNLTSLHSVEDSSLRNP